MDIMQLRQHQTKAATRAANKGRLAFFHDCGTGKTVTALETIRQLEEQHGKLKTLVVCPLLLIRNAWMADLMKFENDWKVINLWDEKPAERIKKLKRDADIYITSFDQFKIMWEPLKEKGFDIMIVDESSKMKNHKSQITKAILAFAGLPCKQYPRPIEVRYRYCLSGTPAPNDLGEYFAQIAFLDRFIFGGHYYAFRSRYFNTINCGGLFNKYEFRKSLYQEFTERMAPVVDVVRKEDALPDLPESIDIDIWVPLGKAEQNAYDDMKRDLVLVLGNCQVLGEHQLTQIQKLRQLACGFVYHEGLVNNEPTRLCQDIEKNPAKLSALAELLDKCGDQQLIIWVNFVRSMEHIAEFLGKKATVLAGTPEQKMRAVEDFTSGTKQYIIQNPASGAHGLNYQHNSHINIYYTPDWSWEFTSQSRDRIHRSGQTQRCVNYHILAEGTIDKLITARIGDKRELCEKVMRHLKGDE